MNEAFMQVMDRVPSHALSTYVFLSQRSKLDMKVGLSQQEISRATRLSVAVVREALGWLATPTYQDAALKTQGELTPFLIVKPYSKVHKIVLLPPYVEAEREVRFTFEDTDSRRITILEAENRRLSRNQHKAPKLSLHLRGERQGLVAEIEGDLGRPVFLEEAFLLGGITDQYGPERVKKAWRQHAHQLDRPIHGLYAMFQNKRFGAKVQVNEPKDEVNYVAFNRDTTPI